MKQVDRKNLYFIKKLEKYILYQAYLILIYYKNLYKYNF